MRERGIAPIAADLRIGCKRRARGYLSLLLPVVLLASIAPGALGTSSAAATTTTPTPTFLPAGAGWLATLNYYRAAANLPPVLEDPALTAAAELHAHYMYMTRTMPHSEDPASPYYTAAGNASGERSNLASWIGQGAQGVTQRGWIEMWMRSALHIVPMLRPGFTHSGFGAEQGPSFGAAGLDVYGKVNAETPPAAPIRFPADGATIPALGAADGGCPGYVGRGQPILVMLPEAPSGVTATLTTSAGASVEFCEVDETNYTDPVYQSIGRDILRGQHVVELIPRYPLVPGTTYHVRARK